MAVDRLTSKFDVIKETTVWINSPTHQILVILYYPPMTGWEEV